jgi:hypothetical protein
VVRADELAADKARSPGSLIAMGRRLRRCGRAGKWVFGRVTEDRLPGCGIVLPSRSNGKT